MRDAKTSFCAVTIKQEPKDITENDNSTNETNHVSSCSNVDQDNISSRYERDLTNNLQTTATVFKSQNSNLIRHAFPQRYNSSFCSQDSSGEISMLRRENEVKYSVTSPSLHARNSAPLAREKQSDESCWDLTTRAKGQVIRRSEALAGKLNSVCDVTRNDCTMLFNVSAFGSRPFAIQSATFPDSNPVPESSGMSVAEGSGMGSDAEVDVEHGTGFVELDAGLEMAGFTCEDCNAHFTSRDTYAMHMLLRAKNEACIPRQKHITTDSTSHPKKSCDNNLTFSPGEGTNLSCTPILESNVADDLKPEIGTERSILSNNNVLTGGSSRQLIDQSPGALIGLGTRFARTTESGAWWSKYVQGLTRERALLGDQEMLGSSLSMICYVCGELFSNRDALAMHVLFHTRDISSMPLVNDSSHQWHGGLSSSPVLMLGQTPGHQSQHHRVQISQHSVQTSFKQQSQLSPISTIETTTTPAASKALSPVQMSSSASPSTPTTASSAAQSSLLLDKIRVNGKQLLNTVPASSPQSDMSSNLCFRHVSNTPLRSDSAVHSGQKCAGDRHARGNSAPAGTSSVHDARNGIGDSKLPLHAKSSCLLKRSRPLSADNVDSRYQPTSRFQHSSKFQTTSCLSNEEADIVGMNKTGSNRESGVGKAVSRRATCNRTHELEGSVNQDPEWENQSHIVTGHSLSVQSVPSQQLQGGNTHTDFSLLRLKRLRKMRMGKSSCLKYTTCRRPSMTSQITANKKHIVRNSNKTMANVVQQFHSPRAEPASTESSSSSSNLTVTTSTSTRIGSMLQLLKTHGHEVNACVHCEIVFADRTLYQLHMGLHNVNSPWQCNACGQVCTSRLQFATHSSHY